MRFQDIPGSMSFSRPALKAAALVSLLALASCGHGVNSPLPNYQTYREPNQMASGGSGLGPLLTFGHTHQNETSGVAVNAYLWRASLDTLSFMPLASADPFAGVIITDWYSPPATPNERFKVTAYVLGTAMTANNLKVSVFRQDQQGGGWVNEPIDHATASGIEDRILARAAQLRAAGQLNG